MHRLTIPTASGPGTFKTAVDSIRRTQDRASYAAAAAEVASCCAEYDRLGASQGFHLANAKNYAINGLGADAMVSLYEHQFLRNNGTKAIRESIRNSAPNGLCPYCGEGSVHELDHYLPKRPYAGTAVHPANLIPACRDCNREKMDFFPSPTDPAVLHPYFDSAFSIRWLHASVRPSSTGKPTVEFRVRPAATDTVLQSRLESHMRVFKLYDRFRVLAGQALNNFETLRLSPLGAGMDRAQARGHLLLTGAQQSGGRVNSWEGATFEAMANDDWYLGVYLALP